MGTECAYWHGPVLDDPLFKFDWTFRHLHCPVVVCSLKLEGFSSLASFRGFNISNYWLLSYLNKLITVHRCRIPINGLNSVRVPGCLYALKSTVQPSLPTNSQHSFHDAITSQDPTPVQFNPFGFHQ